MDIKLKILLENLSFKCKYYIAIDLSGHCEYTDTKTGCDGKINKCEVENEQGQS